MSDIPSFKAHVAVLPGNGLPVALRPDEAERAQIASACGVRGFGRLEADLTLKRWRRDGVELRGEIRAIVLQDCVITLEPLENEIREEVLMTFLPENSRLSRRQDESTGELVLDPEGPDLPESFSGETIDLWPVVVECLVLAIDPFPRAPGAALDQGDIGQEAQSREESPFSALKALKKDVNRPE